MQLQHFLSFFLKKKKKKKKTTTTTTPFVMEKRQHKT